MYRCKHVIGILLFNTLFVVGRTSEVDTSLIEACGDSDMEKVVEAIGNGANVNSVTDAGETPLHVAGIHGNVEILKLLLSKGANVNARATSKSSLSYQPLHWWIHPAGDNTSYLEGAELLLENGADVNAIVKNEEGVFQTAVDICLRISDIRNDALVILKKYGGLSYSELNPEL